MQHSPLIIRYCLYWIFGIGLFLLPLINAWLVYPFSIQPSQTSYSALLGILPWSDAQGYYAGASNLLNDGLLDYWNTRRPLNALLFSFRLWLTNNNFQMALVLQAVLCAISCLLVCRVIKQRFGTISSLAAFIVLFLFASTFIPTTLSETLGLTLGCLGFIFLWDSIQTKHLSSSFLAGLMLMVGFNVRAGALFVLPLIIFWFGYHFRVANRGLFAFNRKHPLAFFLGICFALLINMLIIKTYSAGEGTVHGNFAYTLFGFVSGGNSWSYAYSLYPELLTKTEAEISQFLIQKSIETFKQNPFLIFIGIAKNLGGLLKTATNFFLPNLSSNAIIKIFIHTLGGFALILAYYRLRYLYKLNKTEMGLLIVSLLGMIFSAATIWKDGGFRVFAVTVPFFAATVGILIGSYFKGFSKRISIEKTKKSMEVWMAVGLSTLLLFSGTIGPKLFLKPSSLGATTISNLPQITCGKNETLLIVNNIFGAPHVNLTHKTAYKKAILKSGIEDQQAFLNILKSETKQPFALALIYDVKARNTKFIVAPIELFSNYKNREVGLCTAPIANANHILQVSDYGAPSEK